MLREEVARHLSAHGLPTTPDEIMITQGALHAWSLVLGAVVAPGDRVLVETPTYPAALDAIAAHGARAVGVALGPAGWDGAQLDEALRRAPPRLAYVVPDFHNPTGILVPAEARQALLRATRRAGTIVVVDEIAAELSLDAGPLPPRLAALGDARHVLTVGSLSKSCWAGLRTGWIRGERRLLQRLAAARSARDSASPVLDGLLAARVLPRLDALVAERRPRIVERRDALADGLARHLPGWRAPRPGGGLWLWAELPTPSSSARRGCARARPAARGRVALRRGRRARDAPAPAVRAAAGRARRGRRAPRARRRAGRARRRARGAAARTWVV